MACVTRNWRLDHFPNRLCAPTPKPQHGTVVVACNNRHVTGIHTTLTHLLVKTSSLGSAKRVGRWAFGTCLLSVRGAGKRIIPT